MMLKGSVTENVHAAPRADALPGPYRTELEPQHEQKFQSWVKDNKIPYQDTPTADYDMRGYYKDVVQKGADQTSVSKFDAKPHFPDTYKTPYHKTFSNESKYAIPEKAPGWKGDRLVARDGTVIADETPKKIEPIFRQRGGKWAIPTRDHIEGEVK